MKLRVSTIRAIVSEIITCHVELSLAVIQESLRLLILLVKRRLYNLILGWTFKVLPTYILRLVLPPSLTRVLPSAGCEVKPQLRSDFQIKYWIIGNVAHLRDGHA